MLKIDWLAEERVVMYLSSDIVVVIPVYKNDLDASEEISLRQVFKVLGAYDICFIAPEGLILNYAFLEDKNFLVEYFDKSYFEGIENYSKLCTSIDFYKRFDRYVFLLIYQLDAFVFYDKLIDFCNYDYDYWGAPVPPVIWEHMPSNIGNGGLSLRKISKIIDVLEKKEYVNDLMESELPVKEVDNVRRNEDKFIVYAANNLPDLDFKFPTIDEALSFSVEYNVNGIYDNIENHLPFGCHRWTKYKFLVWRKIIESLGYKINDDYANELINNCVDSYYDSLVLARFAAGIEEKEKHLILEKLFGTIKISVWGMGKAADSCIAKLNTYGFKIINKYDKKLADGNLILYPSVENIGKELYPVILISHRYEKEMRREFDNMNIEKNIRILSLAEVEEMLVHYWNIGYKGDVLIENCYS